MMVSLLLGAADLVSARLVGAGVVDSWLLAAAMTAAWFIYLLVFINLHILGYFPRPAERFVDRGLAIIIALHLAYLAIRTAPTTGMAIFLCLVNFGMAGYALARNKRDLAEPLRRAATHPRSSADARIMLALSRSLQGHPLAPRDQFLTLLNTAKALVVLAESEESYRHLHEAYDILLDLAVRPASAEPVATEPGLRVLVTEALVDVGSSLHGLGDDPNLYEQAALLLDEALTRDTDGAAGMSFQRLVNLAGLKIARSGALALATSSEPMHIDALSDAAGYLAQALPISPRHRLAEMHVTLAIVLAMRADQTDDKEALSNAIGHTRLALRHVHWANRELRPTVQLMLADLLVQRASVDPPAPVDLDQAERLTGPLRAEHEPGIRMHAWFVFARALRIRHQIFGTWRSTPDTRILAVGQRAVAAAPDSHARLRAAAMIGLWAAEAGLTDGAAWGYREALATARRLSATGLARRQQQAPLYEVRGLAAECVHWLLADGRVHDAVVALESSRALVLSAAVNRELLIRRLWQQDSRLARQCADLSSRLARVDPAGAPDNGLAYLLAVQRHRGGAPAVHDEWRRMTEWLAQWPEFRALLDEPSYHHILKAARRQPLVYLAAAQRCGYALIVEPNAAGPRVVELPGLLSGQVSDLAHRFRADTARLGETSYARTNWHTTLTDGLDWLRETAMGPLTAQLGLAGPLTLIPVGDLALLPLHAATEDSPAGDVIWSYAPSARILGRIGEAAMERGTDRPAVLHVAAPGTGQHRLHYTDLVPSALNRHAGIVTAVGDNTGQRHAVLAAASRHQVYHFACHGAADSYDPLDSHLRLADGLLTIRDLLGQRLPARLAVLAACETGIPYAQLPDEAVSLPAALLEAGVPGVVGTLWPVEELPTLLLTTRFYELWLGRRLPPAEALHHAQQWLRTSTVEDFKAYLHDNVSTAVRWPYRTTRRLGQHRIFAHPDCWAAFTYTGA
jgi:hypothetical protein